MQLGSGLGAGSFLGKCSFFCILEPGSRVSRGQAALLLLAAPRWHSELGGQSRPSAASALPLCKHREGKRFLLSSGSLWAAGCQQGQGLLPAAGASGKAARACGWGWARLTCAGGGTRAQEDQIVLVPYQPSWSLGPTVGKTKWGGFHSRSTLGIEV